MASPASPPDLPMFARNVLHFVRLLRASGLPMSPAHAIDAMDALRVVEIGRRDDVHDALAAILTHSADERAFFDTAFDLFWRDPDW